MEASDPGILGNGFLATAYPPWILLHTMERWGFSLLFLARISASHSHLERQRVSELVPGQGALQPPACPLGAGQQTCPFPLLPWALLLALLAAIVAYFLFSRGQEGAEPGLDPDAPLDEVLLRDIFGVLHSLRYRLVQIRKAKRKLQCPADGSIMNSQ